MIKCTCVLSYSVIYNMEYFGATKKEIIYVNY